MSHINVSTKVNGDEIDFVCPADEVLLDSLRNRLGLSGAKEGCGTGDCGASSVTVNGRLVCSCLVLSAEADKLHPLQQAFLDHAALQCVICTPGILVAAQSLLEKNPDPTDEELRYWVADNLCRCTGYDKIIRAVQSAAAQMRSA